MTHEPYRPDPSPSSALLDAPFILEVADEVTLMTLGTTLLAGLSHAVDLLARDAVPAEFAGHHLLHIASLASILGSGVIPALSPVQPQVADSLTAKLAAFTLIVADIVLGPVPSDGEQSAVPGAGGTPVSSDDKPLADLSEDEIASVIEAFLVDTFPDSDAA